MLKENDEQEFTTSKIIPIISQKKTHNIIFGGLEGYNNYLKNLPSSPYIQTNSSSLKRISQLMKTNYTKSFIFNYIVVVVEKGEGEQKEICAYNFNLQKNMQFSSDFRKLFNNPNDNGTFDMTGKFNLKTEMDPSNKIPKSKKITPYGKNLEKALEALEKERYQELILYQDEKTQETSYINKNLLLNFLSNENKDKTLKALNFADGNNTIINKDNIPKDFDIDDYSILFLRLKDVNGDYRIVNQKELNNQLDKTEGSILLVKDYTGKYVSLERKKVKRHELKNSKNKSKKHPTKRVMMTSEKIKEEKFPKTSPKRKSGHKKAKEEEKNKDFVLDSKIIDDCIKAVAKGEEVEKIKNVEDMITNQKKDIDILDLTEKCLKNFYFNESEPKEEDNIDLFNAIDDDYIKAYDLNHKEFFIIKRDFENKLNNSKLENEILMNKSDQTFRPYNFLALKYLKQKGIPLRKLHLYKKNLLNETQNQIDPYQLALIEDEFNQPHLAKANQINKLNPKKHLIDEVTKKPFIPKEDDIEFFSPFNDIGKIYNLKNINDEDIYVSYPFIKYILNDLEHSRIQDNYNVYDINKDKQKISKDQAEKLMYLTNIFQCLNGEKEDNFTKVQLLNGKKIDIPVLFIDELCFNMEKKNIINTKEYYIDKNGKECSINPFKIRPIKKNLFLQKLESLPYCYKDENSIIYRVSNLKDEKDMFFSKPQIIELINSNNEDYYLDELKTSLNPSNVESAYIGVEDTNKEKVFVPKICLMKYVLHLCNNQSIPNEFTYNNSNINLKDTLLSLIQITPSPYFKDEILRDPNNTYIENKDSNEFEKTNELNQSNDLFELLLIKDVYGNDLIVRKPFVRNVLYLNMNLKNVQFYDSAFQLRTISPSDLLVEDFRNPNLLKIPACLIYLEVNDKLIPKDIYRKCLSLYKNNKDNGNIKIKFYNILNKKWQDITIGEVVNNIKSKEWIIVEDIHSEKIIILKSALMRILNEEKKIKKNLYEIYDFYCILRTINVFFVISFLNNGKREQNYEINLSESSLA